MIEIFFSVLLFILLFILILTVPFIALILGIINYNKLNKLEKLVANFTNSAIQTSPKETQVPQIVFDTNQNTSPAITTIQPEKIDNTNVQTPAPKTPLSSEPDAFSKFINWLKEDWILKLGAILILSGFGWFTSFLFTSNLVGPYGRISIGILVGIAILIFGTYRIAKYSLQGGIFLALGSGIILLTVYAGRVAFDLYPPAIALVFMLLVAIYVSFVSIVNNNKSISILGICVGMIAPILTSSPTSEYVPLFMYLLVVYLGNLWIIYKTQTRAINLISLGFLFIYSLPYLIGFVRSDRQIIILIIFMFSGLLFLSTIENILKSLRSEDTKINILDIITSALNGAFIILWIVTATSREWQSLTAVAWAIVFAFGSYFTLKLTKNYYPFYVHFLIALSMLLTATSIQLKGASVFYAILFQIMTASILAYTLLKKLNFAQFINIFLLIPIFMTIPHFIDTNIVEGTGSSIRNQTIILNTSYFLNPSYYVILIAGISFCLLGLFYRKEVRESVDTWVKFINTTVIIVGSLYIFRSIWITFYEVTQNPDFARALTLFTITAICLTSYFYGIYENRRVPKYYGGIMVGLVVINILIFDLWNLSIFGRVLTLFLVGSLLLSTALISKNIEKKAKENNPQIISIK